MKLRRRQFLHLAAPRVRPTIRISWRCAASSARTSSLVSCSRSACPDPCRRRGRNSQFGNNNAYCQDTAGSSGRLGLEGDDITAFVGQMTELRWRFPQIRGCRWLDGRRADGTYGVLWLRPDAEEMKEADWKFREGRFVAYVLGPLEPRQCPIFIVLNAARKNPVQAAEK